MSRFASSLSTLVRRAQSHLPDEYAFFDVSYQLALGDHTTSSTFNTHTLSLANVSTHLDETVVSLKHNRHSVLDRVCRNKEGWGPASTYRDLDFTPCFEDAAFGLGPAIVLALFAAVTITKLSDKPIRQLSKASHTILYMKNALVVALGLCTALQASTLFSGYKSPLKLLSFWASLASLASFALALALQHLNHTRMRRSCTVLLQFWLFHIIAGAIRIRTLATYPSPPIADNTTAFAIQATQVSLIFVVFALECAGVEIGSSQNANKVNGVNGLPSHLESGDPRSSSFSRISEGSGYEAVDPAANTVGEKECPEVTANFFSRIFFHWMQPMMTLGSKKFLTEDDMWSLPPGEDAENLGRKFEKYYKSTRQKNGKPRFWVTLASAYGGPFLFAAFLKAAQDALAFVQPQLLRLLLTFVESRDTKEKESSFHGYLYCLLFFVVAVVQTSCLHAYFQRCFTTGMRVRAGLVSSIFKKSLRMSNEDRAGRTTGDIVNLMSVDATRLQDLCTYGHVIWSALFQMTLAFVSLYNLLGWPSFVGVAIMVVSVPVNTWLARYMRKLAEQTMKVKDKRTRLMNEILTNIKSIKLFAWEEAFTRKLASVRNDEELTLLKKAGAVNAFFNFFWTVIPFFVSLSTFIVYSATTDKPLTAAIIFPALSLYQLLSFPLAMLAGIVAAIIQALVSARRLSAFLDAGELDSNARKVILPADPLDPLLPDSPADEAANVENDAMVVMRNAEFKWSRSQPVPTLSDIDLTVKKGELLAVLGRVGDGKSSLLSAILGEMYRSDGQCIIRGRTAYFTQGGWCMGATIRDNILFGLKYEPDFYQRVIEACALPPDLAILPNGDLTEVGEKGVSLSGGQKARVALARACYARADIYLLDDPLAAVDAHVGAHIFKYVIGPEGLLKTKTRILTTNTVSFLPQADQIVSLRRGIFQQERGTYDQVMQARGDIFNLINGLGKQSANKNGEEEEHQQIPVAVDNEKAEEQTHEVIDYDNELAHTQSEEGLKETKLHRRLSTASIARPRPLTKLQIKQQTLRQLRETMQQKEHQEQGSVKGEVYKQYASSASVIGLTLYLLAQIATQVLQVSRDIVLKQWGTHNSETGGSTGDTQFYLTIYGLVGLAASVAVCIAPYILYTWLAISSAKRFHDNMFRSVLRAPLQWFETIPTGRLLNLFSRDVNVIDEVLPRVLHSFFRTMVIVLGVLVVICASVPPFLIAVIPIALIYRAIMRYYLATSRELKRLDAVSKTPIFTWFQESLGGLSTIRAFGQETRFVATSEARVDRNQMCFLPSITCNRWLAVRIELLGSTMIVVAMTLAVVLVTRGGKMDAGLLGLMMSQAINTTQTLNWVVRSASEVEQNVVSVERVLSYSNTKPEAPYEVDEKPPKEWPSQGKIEFRNYSTRYRADLGPVLKNVSMTIANGERIAVVGRTGAGKSSLTLALFRIIEPTEGTILIDDYDCRKLGLKDLRSNIAIIPQDPQLWEGTLRDNVDPTGTYTDEQMWKSLEQARLKDHVTSLPGGLDAQLNEGASNFSSGQRQLLCVARALLRGSKILVLDEATSSVDLHSDALIQDMVRNELSNKTLITIAHRLWTIISYDRVAVFEQGALVEFDTPLALYDKGKTISASSSHDGNSNGEKAEQPPESGGAFFFSMCEKAGISREEIERARPGASS